MQFFYTIFVLSCLLFCQTAFAIGDSIATTEGGLYVLIGVGLFIMLFLVVLVYFCVKIAEPKQRGKWVLLGGLPSILCAVVFSWKLAIVIAFGVALYLRPKPGLMPKQESKPTEDLLPKEEK